MTTNSNKTNINQNYDIKNSIVSFSTFPFNDNTPKIINRKCEYGTNSPVVYIINNNDEAYVGETVDACTRAKQHLQNEERRHLNKLNIIGDKTFNKSVILDLESFLIKYMSADNKFKLQNGNGGLKNHNYYQKDEYDKKFEYIWENILRKSNLADKTLMEIRNSDLFKFSPYKALTSEQYSIVYDLIRQLEQDIIHNEDSTFIVEGGPGTGKTILAIYIIKLLSDSLNNLDNYFDDDVLSFNVNKDLKIGIVIPMISLRKTLENVFKNTSGLSKKMIFSPLEIGKTDEMFDILVVDEAHRLRQRKNLPSAGVYRSFKEINEKLELGEDATELDWITKKSHHQIFMYDSGQSVKPTDIKATLFDFASKLDDSHKFVLTTQLRCLKGGDEYIKYIDDLLACRLENKISFEEYDFKLFDDVNDMVENIKLKNQEYDLCRTVAGYSWDYNSKKDHNKYDIFIEKYKYRWNSKTSDWINSKDSINEIGCIHTIQGYDLNYCGVIIGNELKYDKSTNKIYVDRDNYKDKMGKDSIPKTQQGDFILLNYIKNIYKVLLTRGVLGTYVYVCDENLREYFSQFIENIHSKE